MFTFSDFLNSKYPFSYSSHNNTYDSIVWIDNSKKPSKEDFLKSYNDYDLKQSLKMNTPYKGKKISLTSKDALGLLQVKTAFELGISETVFVFQNGTKMVFTPDTFSDLSIFFAQKRNELFN